MNDRELCEIFGISLEEVEDEVARIEAGDYSGYDFSRVIPGRPIAEKDEMTMVSASIPSSRIKAIKSVTDREGISRSDFIRRAIDRELLVSGL